MNHSLLRIYFHIASSTSFLPIMLISLMDKTQPSIHMSLLQRNSIAMSGNPRKRPLFRATPSGVEDTLQTNLSQTMILARLLTWVLQSPGNGSGFSERESIGNNHNCQSVPFGQKMGKWKRSLMGKSYYILQSVGHIDVKESQPSSDNLMS